MAQGSVPSDRFPEVLAQVHATLQPLLARAS